MWTILAALYVVLVPVAQQILEVYKELNKTAKVGSVSSSPIGNISAMSIHKPEILDSINENETPPPPWD